MLKKSVSFYLNKLQILVWSPASALCAAGFSVFLPAARRSLPLQQLPPCRSVYKSPAAEQTDTFHVSRTVRRQTGGRRRHPSLPNNT